MKNKINILLMLLCLAGAIIGFVQDDKIKIFSFVLFGVLLSIRDVLLNIEKEIKRSDTSNI